MTWLGVAYSGGRGVERDEARAIQYFRESADRGHAHAQFCLGNCYAQGDGVKKNLRQAASWYRRAAEQGNEGAQWDLALLLYHGTDGSEDEDAALKNRKEAALWFQKAAEQESRDAAGRLAGMYSTGKGVRRSQERRDFWNQRSIDIDRRTSLRHDARMKVRMVWFNSWRRDDGEYDIEDSERTAARIETAARLGEVNAQVSLGFAYEDGLCVPKDLSLSAKWYTEAATKGNADAQNRLAWMYIDGEGVSRDFGRAAEWFQRAASEGGVRAQIQLAWMYENGVGVDQDSEKASRLYRLTEDSENPDALCELAFMYSRGNGVPVEEGDKAVSQRGIPGRCVCAVDIGDEVRKWGWSTEEPERGGGVVSQGCRSGRF